MNRQLNQPIPIPIPIPSFGLSLSPSQSNPMKHRRRTRHKPIPISIRNNSLPSNPKNRRRRGAGVTGGVTVETGDGRAGGDVVRVRDGGAVLEGFASG